MEDKRAESRLAQGFLASLRNYACPPFLLGVGIVGALFVVVAAGLNRWDR